MAGLIQFTNNAATLLASSITSGDTSLTVTAATGSLFPTLAGGQYFYCTLTNAAATVIEIVKVTARSTDTFTIVRAQDGTSASAFSAGEKVELRLVAVELQNFPQLDSTNTFAAAQTFSATPVFSAGITSTVTPVGVTSGGTGLGTLTANNVILGAGTSTPTFVAPSTSGNLLTSNGTTWVSSTPATPNVAGGATVVSQGTSLTLTSASTRVQNISLTAGSLSVTLPDATTLSAGGPTFIMTNTGLFAFDLKLNGGSILLSFGIGQSVELRLVDNSTAAGEWNVSNTNISIYPSVTQFAPVQIDSNLSVTSGASVVNGNGTRIDCLKLTSTTALLVWIRASNQSVYACVATNTSGVISYGTTVQLYNGSAGGTAAVAGAGGQTTSLLTGLTTGMCFVTRSATAVAVPFSISGTTITVGTTSATFGSTQISCYNVTGRAVLSSTVMLIAYATAPTTAVLNTITYNGASAPTLGTASTAIAVRSRAQDSPGIQLINLTATTSFAAYQAGATAGDYQWDFRIITTSGVSAPTLGTAISQTITDSVAGDDPGVLSGYLPCTLYAPTSTSVTAIFSAAYNWVPNTASYTISGTTVTANVAPKTINVINPITPSTSLGLGSNPSWASSTEALWINTMTFRQSHTINTSTTAILKQQYISGNTTYYSGNITAPLASYSSLTNACALTATTGIAVGYSSVDGTPQANVVTII